VLVPVAPILLAVVATPLGCAFGHDRSRIAWLYPPSWKIYSTGLLVLCAAFLVAVGSRTLLVIVESALASRIFMPLMASASLPGHHTVSLPHLRPTPACPYGATLPSCYSFFYRHDL
jgi:hypothetical protein